MIQSVNRRHHIEILLMVVIGIALVLNVNSSVNGVGQGNPAGPSPPTQTVSLQEGAESIVNSVANVADNVQSFTEEGAIDSFVSTVTAPFQSGPSSEGSSSVHNESGGGIGDWIRQSGIWLLGVLSPSKETIQRTAKQGRERSWLPDSMSRAGDEFGHLSRASVSTVEQTGNAYGTSQVFPTAITLGWY